VVFQCHMREGISWLFDGTTALPHNARAVRVNNSTASLEISNIQLCNEGTYSCSSFVAEYLLIEDEGKLEVYGKILND